MRASHSKPWLCAGKSPMTNECAAELLTVCQFLLLPRNLWRGKEVSACSQEECKGHCTHKYVKAAQVGLQHLSRNNECNQFQDGYEIVSHECSDQLDADDDQKNAINELVIGI